ncbi:MAG: pullulanase-type alpha-1,6-glucosidase [Chloroflexi bacterium]|nr:pullulanase-type alpha-1,6-glucosidase [Chloroflexota bacterium]
MLTYDEEDDLWTGTFDLPAGEWEYKGALNGSWDLSYGVNADGTPGSPNIPLVLEEDTTVTFFYSHTTNWVTDNVNSLIANLAGDFQEEIGCPGDWQPDCLRTWLQDPDGDGIYHYGTTLIPAGSWEVKVPVNQSWDLSYGVDGNDAAGSPNIPFTVPEEGSYVEFFFDSETKLLRITSDGEVPTPTTVTPNEARAYWVNERQIVWDIPNRVGAEYRLYYSPTAELEFGAEGITGGEYITLTRDPGGMREDSAEKFPHLTEMEMVLRIPDEEVAKIPEILKSQIGIMATDYTGAITGATGLQIPGVLDDLYTYSGELGVIWDGDTPTLRVWAPTAQNVRLHLFADADPATESTVYDMELNPEFGIWSTTGDPGWEWQYYLYEVQVYAPSTQQIETNLVTDPYSLSLAMNSTRSQIVDLSDPALMPEGWEDLAKPELERFEDVVLYELHIRDFSVNDPTVPEEYQGTYMAFTVDASNGMTHLRNLAEAGLTHLHLLPSFDIATIDENKANWEGPTFEELSQYPSDSEEQQALIDAVRDQDGFNWGYDPYHYTVPEGSYSTDPDGPQRIIEYREMVMSLNQNGIRVVMDVVYNHTNSAGQAEKSVLDRIVPGYYHRLNERGGVSTSTCCQNTATEHNMMRKLMVDSVITWSTAYKVDGYRFDLMGHHMLTDMLEVREALNSLTLEQDGIDGSKIYVYGEGWNFGEVADNARGVNATQLNIAGTGIGAFNDRLRDAVRGGNPFGGWQEQGFATGLYYDPNAITPGTEEEQLQRLLLFADQIRIGLAGNLEDYTFESASGEIVNGTEIPYNNSPAAYTQDPQENIVYISAHDNETWFDAIQYKMPQDATVEERVRAHNVGVSIVSLSQGVPFFHAGIDMLRSKSLDRNSYNSGDWFNRLDFSYEFNNWAVGLPPAGDNEANWDIMRPLLAQEGITPEQADILQAVDHLQEMLQIRKSSPLFRLETAEAVQESLAFHNTGPDQIPGVIVMSLTDSMEIDPNYSMIVVVFNATDEAVDFTEDTVAGVPMELHPVQVSSSDPVVQTASYDAASGTFSVPARTTAVFVAPQQ